LVNPVSSPILETKLTLLLEFTEGRAYEAVVYYLEMFFMDSGNMNDSNDVVISHVDE